MENENEMQTNLLDRKLVLKPVGSYIKKSDYAGKTMMARIVNVTESSFKGKLVISLFFTGDVENKLLTLGQKGLNQLVNLFGDTPKDWLNRNVVCEFSEMTKFEITRDKQKLDAEGVEVTFKLP